jgi:hypothetical protein
MIFLKGVGNKMSSTVLRLLTKFVTLGIIITCIILLTYGVNLAGYWNAGSKQATVSRVAVKSQPDTPLRLTVLIDDSSNPNSPSITIEVTNTGTQAIRAYSISQETVRGNEKSNWLMFADMGILSEGLQAGQYSTDELSCPSTWDENSKMFLAVDLVEFADGTTWGPDAEKSMDMLGGRRAGERQAARKLLKTYKKRGIKATIKSLEESYLMTPSPDGYTPEWKEGFQNGQQAITQRIKAARKKGGVKQVEE